MEAKPDEPRVVTLRAVEATPESIAPFGQVIAASPDGDQFGPHDAQLDLSRDIPRFYIMRLENRPLGFSTITHHAGVTQCLGAIGGQDWYLGVAKLSIVDGAPEQSGQHDGRSPVQSRAGHYYLPPDPAEVCVFQVSGPKFLKLHTGTWHAGLLFKEDAVDFYNLELSNTNCCRLLPIWERGLTSAPRRSSGPCRTSTRCSSATTRRRTSPLSPSQAAAPRGARGQGHHGRRQAARSAAAAHASSS